MTILFSLLDESAEIVRITATSWPSESIVPWMMEASPDKLRLARTSSSPMLIG